MLTKLTVVFRRKKSMTAWAPSTRCHLNTQVFRKLRKAGLSGLHLVVTSSIHDQLVVVHREGGGLIRPSELGQTDVCSHVVPIPNADLLRIHREVRTPDSVDPIGLTRATVAVCAEYPFLVREDIDSCRLFDCHDPSIVIIGVHIICANGILPTIQHLMVLGVTRDKQYLEKSIPCPPSLVTSLGKLIVGV